MHDRRRRLGVLHDMVNSIKKTRPDEDVYVDEENVKIVWGKPSGQDSIDAYKRDYPWI